MYSGRGSNIPGAFVIEALLSDFLRNRAHRSGGKQSQRLPHDLGRQVVRRRLGGLMS